MTGERVGQQCKYDGYKRGTRLLTPFEGGGGVAIIDDLLNTDDLLSLPGRIVLHNVLVLRKGKETLRLDLICSRASQIRNLPLKEIRLFTPLQKQI